MGAVRAWVPHEPIAAAIRDLPGVEVEVGGAQDWPAGAAQGEPPIGGPEVEFFVPPFFAKADAIAALARMPKLKVVQAQTAGVDLLIPHVPPGAVLCNARGVHDASTAEWVVTAILSVLHDFGAFARAQTAQRWDYHVTGCLAGLGVLIVGYGSIGRAVEQRLAGFEVDVRRVARTPRPGVSGLGELPELLPEADVVVLLAPVTPDTIGMVGAAFLARMRDGALLVNAARGSLVVTGALLAELRSGRLRAAVDVTDPEPLPPGHPLWTAPNVLITPHVAGSTPASQRRILQLIRAQLERYLRGEPLENVVTGSY